MMKVNGGDGKRPDFSFVYPRTRLHSSSECFTQLLVGRLFLVLNKMEDTFGWDSSTECPRHLLMLFILLRHREREKRGRERDGLAVKIGKENVESGDDGAVNCQSRSTAR